ncbi:MAG TPA: hypothetical protein VMU62_06755, partial [Acidobacteriaceae bacterium]|nr:hypothetical protein [Acidobacteriaceae bacterium]
HAGATANTPMPVYAILAVAFGIALARLFHWLPRLSAAWSQAGLTLLLLATCTQLASQFYSPKLSIPSPEVRASQQQFVDWLRSFPGDAFVVDHPYAGVLAGKLPHADETAIHDALRPGLPAINRPLLHEIHRAVDQESFDAIVLDRMPPHKPSEARPYDAWLPQDWQTHYPILGLAPGSGQASPFGPLPRYVLLSCRASELAAAKDIKILSSSASVPCPGPHPR